MIKKIAFASLGIVLLTLPVFASANSLSDLQAQIQQLIAQINAMKAQISTNTSASGSATASASACITLSDSMSLDDTDATTGGDVTRLQQFLANLGVSIYPEARITGYFGPATERAVQRWQAAHGLVSSGDPDSTGYGYVGPKTRNAMTCTDTSTSTNTSGTYVPPTTTYISPTPTPVVSTTPACSINASPNPASSGQTVTLNWTSQNAVSAAWAPDTSGKDNIAVPAGTPGTSGAATIVANVIGNPTVTLRVYAANGSSNTCTATFSVPSPYPTVNYVPNSGASIDQSTLTTSSYHPTISGTADTNGVYLSITNSSTGIGVSGSPFLPVTNGHWSYAVPQTLVPGTYSVQVLGTQHTVTGTLTIAGSISGPVITTFTASPASITAGNSSTLSWAAANTAACGISVISGNTVGIDLTQAVNGANGVTSVTTGALSQSATYELRCAPLTGSTDPYAIKDLTVSVTPPQDITFAPAHGTFTLYIGQTATDGSAGIRIKLESLATDQYGRAVANATVTSSGFSPGFYSAAAGTPLIGGGGIGDALSPTSGMIIDVTSVSIPNGTATFTIDPGQGKG